MNGPADTCLDCGAIFFADTGHACAPAHLLPEGTLHPDPDLAARGWQVVAGMWRRVTWDDGGEESAA